MLLCQLDQLIMRYATSANKYHAVSRVIGFDIIDQVRTLNTCDVLFRTENRSSQGLVLVCCSMEVVKYNFLQLLIYLFLLSQDYISLSLDGGWFQLGVLENIGQNVDGLRDIRVERFRVIHSIFPLY